MSNNTLFRFLGCLLLFAVGVDLRGAQASGGFTIWRDNNQSGSTYLTVTATGTTEGTNGPTLNFTFAWTAGWEGGGYLVQMDVATEPIGGTVVSSSSVAIPGTGGGHNNTAGSSTHTMTWPSSVPPSQGQVYVRWRENQWHNSPPGTAGVMTWGDPPPSEVVKVSGTNTTDQTLKYQFRDQNGNVLYEVVVAPGESYNQTIDVTGMGVSDVTPYVLTKANYGDGEVWEVTEDWNPNGIPSDPITPTTTTDPNEVETTNVPPPPQLPPAPTTSTTKGVNTWTTPTASTTDGDRLDKTTFKQGVDKVTVAIEKVNTTLGSLGTGSGEGDGESTLGENAAGQEFDEEGEPVVIPANKAQVLGIESKLPELPAFILPETQSSITIGFDFSPLGLNGSTPMEVDFSEFSVAISVFKLIVRAVLAVFFAVVATRMIRGAFAG